MANRVGDNEDKVWFRMERCFKVDGQWFFTTREGTEVGPFPDKASAGKGIEIYLDCIKDEKSSGEYAAQLALSGVWASNHYK